MMQSMVVILILFLSTLSLRRATYLINTYHRIFGISIHALLAESDLRVLDGSKSSIKISIHALLAESDLTRVVSSAGTTGFLSTLSLRRATRETTSVKPIFSISIHALLAESDFYLGKALHAFPLFLSTLSLRRATSARPEIRRPCVISIHALLAESDRKGQSSGAGISISIHALLAESDLTWHCIREDESISIHALLAESDGFRYFYIIKITKFLSTLSLRRATVHALKFADAMLFLSTLSLRRATGKSNKLAGQKLVFLSTLSLRRATVTRVARTPTTVISIHALLAESDQTKTLKIAAHGDFYPRSPCGERRASNRTEQPTQRISIHALLAESDRH